MNVKQNFNDHCWHVRGYTLLSMSFRLRLALAIVIVRQMISHLRNPAIASPSHPLLQPGTIALTSAGDGWLRNGFVAKVAVLLNQYDSTVEPGERDKFFEVIKDRARRWRNELEAERVRYCELTTLESHLQAVAAKTSNPFALPAAFQQLVTRLKEVIHSSNSRLQDSLTHERELEAQIHDDLQKLKEREKRYSEFKLRQQQQPQIPKPVNAQRQAAQRWKTPAVTGIVILLLVLMLGYSLVTALMPSLFGAIIARLFSGRGKVTEDDADGTPAKEENTEAGFVGKLPERLRQKIQAYGRAVEQTVISEAEARAAEDLLRSLELSTWASRAITISRAVAELEVSLERGWDGIPEGPFHEADPGTVEILGRELAKTLVGRWLESKGPSTAIEQVLSNLERNKGATLSGMMLNGEGASVALDLIDAAQEAYGILELEDVVAVICETGEGERLFVHWLQSLVETACASSNLRRDVRLDSTLSVARLTVGLPEGDKDPLASLVTQRFSKATVVLSSIPNSIEIVFDLRNVPAEALLTHALTREHYDSASSWERDFLWHFPPRATNEERSKRLLPSASTTARPGQGITLKSNGHNGEIIFPEGAELEAAPSNISGNGNKHN